MERQDLREPMIAGRDPAIDGYADNLHLSTEDIGRLRAAEAAITGNRTERRWEQRIAWTSRALAEFTGPTGATSRAVVYPFDVSTKGVGLFHAAFLHTGTRVKLRLWFDEKEPIVAEGIVRRCAFLTGRAHAVGVEFSTPLPDGITGAPAVGTPHAVSYANLPATDPLAVLGQATAVAGLTSLESVARAQPSPSATLVALESLIEHLAAAMRAAQAALAAAQSEPGSPVAPDEPQSPRAVA
ncbi:MAG: PilZ domain-containing protein [Phycisphaerae bacterium]|nr:PilZ domain-containing protein [Phycisphaerae bacterium]